MPDTNTPNPKAGQSERSAVARWVIGGGIGALAGLAAVLIIADTKEGSKTAFTMLVPLIGTWVGTVLAYYFSGENFQRASDSVSQMVGQVMADKLKTIPVKEAMIARANMSVVALQPKEDGSNVNLKTELLDRFNDTVTRLPVLDDAGVAKYIIHQSEVFEFVTKKTAAQTTVAPVDVTKLTLKDFLEFNNKAQFVAKTMAFVAIDQTLSDAKAKMEAIPDCQDVFVTDDGDKSKPVRGWLLNVEIAKRAKV